MRELASVYRDRLRLDGMLINAFIAILRLNPHDRPTLDALAEKYRELGRWNDLINVLDLGRGAERSDSAHRVAIYWQVAQLWLDHFSNYNLLSRPAREA